MLPSPHRNATPGSPSRGANDIALPRLLIAPLVIAIPLLIALQGFDLDRVVLDHVYDIALKDFPLRHTWMTAVLLHTWVRLPVLAAGLMVLTALAGTAFNQPWRPLRGMLVFLLLGMVLSAATVAAIKHFASGACPYRLTLYGGEIQRLGWFDSLPVGARPGRCWPGGHASTAFALFPWYFVVRERIGSRAARWTLVAIVVFGAVLTSVQVLRGIHWPSDQVYTALVCWYVTLALYAWWRRQRFNPAASAATAP